MVPINDEDHPVCLLHDDFQKEKSVALLQKLWSSSLGCGTQMYGLNWPEIYGQGWVEKARSIFKTIIRIGVCILKKGMPETETNIVQNIHGGEAYQSSLAMMWLRQTHSPWDATAPNLIWHFVQLCSNTGPGFTIEGLQCIRTDMGVSTMAVSLIKSPVHWKAWNVFGKTVWQAPGGPPHPHPKTA